MHQKTYTVFLAHSSLMSLFLIGTRVFAIIVLQVRCFKWQVVCSLNRTQGCRKQQQGYFNAVTPLKTSQ